MKSILAEKASGNLKQFFGNKTFIELSTQAAKNLIIHLYKCYIRKHFKKNRTIPSFFFLKNTIWTSHCVPRIVLKKYSDINLKVKKKNNESKKKSISSKLINEL